MKKTSLMFVSLGVIIGILIGGFIFQLQELRQKKQEKEDLYNQFETLEKIQNLLVEATTPIPVSDEIRQTQQRLQSDPDIIQTLAWYKAEAIIRNSWMNEYCPVCIEFAELIQELEEKADAL